MIYDILRQRRDIILKEWEDSTLDFYANNLFKVREGRNDRFGNPLVYTISNGLVIILEELIGGTHTGKLDDALEDIVKIRSLQMEKPSSVIGFLSCLKEIIKNHLGDYNNDRNAAEEIDKLYSVIDDLIFSAFDIFMRCREKIYEIKANEIKKRSYKLWERVNMIDPALRQKGEFEDDSD